jgi:hypothetical protein
MFLITKVFSLIVRSYKNTTHNYLCSFKPIDIIFWAGTMDKGRIYHRDQEQKSSQRNVLLLMWLTSKIFLTYKYV